MSFIKLNNNKKNKKFRYCNYLGKFIIDFHVFGQYFLKTIVVRLTLFSFEVAIYIYAKRYHTNTKFK